jgi:hypothetical protein
MSSKVLEGRGIRHPAAIERDVFVREFKTIQGRRKVGNHYSVKHKMSGPWATMMDKTKTWRTVSEVKGRIGAAAWAWIQHRCGLGLGVPVEAAALSVLILPFVLVLPLLRRPTE